MSLLHNDFRIQPLDSMAAWVRRLNFLFPVQPLLTFIYANFILQIYQAKLHIKSTKNGLFLNSGRLCRFATTSEGYA